MRKSKLVSIAAITLLILQMIAMIQIVGSEPDGYFTVDVSPEKVTVDKQYDFVVNVTNVNATETYVFVNITYPAPPGWLLKKVIAPDGWAYNINATHYYVDFWWMEVDANKLKPGTSRFFTFEMRTPPAEKISGCDSKNGTEVEWTVFVNKKYPPTSGGKRGPRTAKVIVDCEAPEINDMPPFIFKGCDNYTLDQGFTGSFPACSEFDVTYPLEIKKDKTFTFPASSKVNFVGDANVTFPVGTLVEFQKCCNASFEHCLYANISKSSKITLPPDELIQLEAGAEVEFLRPDPAFIQPSGITGKVIFRNGSEISIPTSAIIKFEAGGKFKWISPHKGKIDLQSGQIKIEGVTYATPPGIDDIPIDTGSLIEIVTSSLIHFDNYSVIRFKTDSQVISMSKKTYDVNAGSRIATTGTVILKSIGSYTTLHFVGDPVSHVWFPGKGPDYPGTFTNVKFAGDSTLEILSEYTVFIRNGCGIHFVNDASVFFESDATVHVKTDAWFTKDSKINVRRLGDNCCSDDKWVPIQFYECGNVTLQNCTNMYFWGCENFTFPTCSKVNFPLDRVITFPECKTVNFERSAKIAIPENIKFNFYEGGKIDFPSGATDLLFQNSSKVRFQKSSRVTFPNSSDVEFQKSTKVEFPKDVGIGSVDFYPTYVEFQKSSKINFSSYYHIGLPAGKVIEFQNESQIDVEQSTEMWIYPNQHDPGVKIHFKNTTTVYIRGWCNITGGWIWVDGVFTIPSCTTIEFSTDFADPLMYTYIHFLSPHKAFIGFKSDALVEFINPVQISVEPNTKIHFIEEHWIRFKNITKISFVNASKVHFLNDTHVHFQDDTKVHFVRYSGGVHFLEDVTIPLITAGSGMRFEAEAAADGLGWSGVKFLNETNIHFELETKVHFKNDTQVYFIEDSPVHFKEPVTVFFTGKNATYGRCPETVTYTPEPHVPYWVKFHKCDSVWFNQSANVLFPADHKVNFEKCSNVTFMSSSKAIIEHDAELEVYAGGRIEFQTHAQFELETGSVIVNTEPCHYAPYSAAAGSVQDITVPAGTIVIFPEKSVIEIQDEDESVHFLKDTTIHFTHWKGYDTEVTFERPSKVHFENDSRVHFKQDTKLRFLTESKVWFNETTEVVEPAWMKVHIKTDLNIKFTEDTILRLYSTDTTTGIKFTRSSKVRFLEPTKIHPKEEGATIKFMSPINRIHPQPDDCQLDVTPIYSVTCARKNVWINVTTYDNLNQSTTVTLDDKRFTLHSSKFFNNTPNCWKWQHYFLNNTAIPDGPLAINITATDCAGNSAWKVIEMVIDNKKPAPSIEVFAVVHGTYRELPYKAGKYWMCNDTETIFIHIYSGDNCVDYDDSTVYITHDLGTPTLVDCRWRVCETFEWDVTGADIVEINATLTDCAWPHNHFNITTITVERDTTPPTFTSVDKTDILGGVVLENFVASDNVEFEGFKIHLHIHLPDCSEIDIQIEVTIETLYSTELTPVPDVTGVWAYDGKLIIDLADYTDGNVTIDIYAKSWCWQKTLLTKTTTVEAGYFHIIELQEGWNLFSVPLIPPTYPGKVAITALFGSIPEAVYEYDAATATWKRYFPGVINEIGDVYDGRGYLVDMDSYNIIIAEGYEMPPPAWLTTPPTYPVLAGWNLVGFTSTTAMRAGDYLASLTTVAGEWTVHIVWGYDAVNQQFTLMFVRDTGIDELMQLGQGFWIFMLAAGDIVPP